MQLTYQPLGDQAVRVGFADNAPTDVALGSKVGEQVAAFVRAVNRCRPVGVTDVVAAYATVAVFYDPLAVDYERLVAWLETAAKRAVTASLQPGRIVEVPTLFGGDDGIDLDACAERLGQTCAQLIEQFTAPIYTVRMIGFLPGFPYLTGLPDHLALPRRAVPRVRVPAGSVGIAGAQAGIYPSSSPGGWNLLGRTTLKLFDPGRTPPTLLKPGDRVRFVAL